MQLESILRVVNVVLLFGVLLFITEPGIISSNFVLKSLFRLAALWTLTFNIIMLFIRHVVKNVTNSNLAKNISLLIFAVFLVLVLLESAFMFIPQSHGVGYTYGGRIWFQYYWHTNSLGYRDDDVQSGNVARKKILIVSDSFTAGHGIKEPNDRFSGVLAKKVGNGYRVYNLGKGGADTTEEYDSLLQFPVSSDILILQYFGNDIEKAATRLGKRPHRFTPYEDLTPFSRLIIRGSYFFNYLYWQFPHADIQPYFDSLISSYKDERILTAHLGDLMKFVTYSRENNVPLLVVVFPFMLDQKSSMVFFEPVQKFFRSHDIPVINVADIVSELPMKERIVNVNDGHASPRVHSLTAEVIYRELRARNIIP